MRLQRERALPPPEVGELWVYQEQGGKIHPFLVIGSNGNNVKMWHITEEYVHDNYTNLIRIDNRWRHEA